LEGLEQNTLLEAESTDELRFGGSAVMASASEKRLEIPVVALPEEGFTFSKTIPSSAVPGSLSGCIC